MDAAARRVKPIILQRLATLRKRREEAARRVVSAAAAAHHRAEDKLIQAFQECSARAQERQNAEMAFKAKLNDRTPVALAVISEAHLRIAGLSEQIEVARIAHSKCVAAASDTRFALDQARADLVGRSSAMKRWEKAHLRVKHAQHLVAESAEELASEEEISDRYHVKGVER